MMKLFKRIGLIAKPNSKDTQETLEHVVQYLLQRGHHLFIEEKSSVALFEHTKTSAIETIGQHCDLIIVIGGDGSLLKAGRHIVDAQIPILGINRGRLGFLADVKPLQLTNSLEPILNGEYYEEPRALLTTTVNHLQTTIAKQSALNDVVLYNADLARMIEFELFVDDQFVMYQRSDGLITATPTGSTAYALSGGGPIVYPTLNAITLVPMLPHTLTSRPIVISDQSTIKLITSQKPENDTKISFDGQVHVHLTAGDEIIIQRHPNTLKLIHPKGYNYFALLRQKLGWNTDISSDRTSQKPC